MNLLLNTAFTENEICFFDSKKIHFYKKWKPKNDSIELINELKKPYLENISEILICIGPGRFTSLRSGVACAKTISYVKKISIYPFTSFEYLKNFNIPKKKNIKYLYQIDLNEIFINGERKIFSKLDNKKHIWYGEVKTLKYLPNSWEQIEIPKLDLDFLIRLKSKLNKTNNISIYYGKEPNISKPKS